MLEITDLQVVYPNGNQALKSISLSAKRGEIIGVIGRSGAGKSTLLRCINGLQEVSKGSVVLDGEAITGMGSQQLRLARWHIGFIWQEYNLVERLPVITNVLTGRLGYNSGINRRAQAGCFKVLDAAGGILEDMPAAQHFFRSGGDAENVGRVDARSGGIDVREMRQHVNKLADVVQPAVQRGLDCRHRSSA